MEFKKAYYRHIPCYFNEETDTLVGRNFIFDLLVSINVFIDFRILCLEELPIMVEIENDNNLKNSRS